MVNCRGRIKCYQRKDRKKCSTPNPWVIFLRANKSQFKSTKEASKYYRHIFKPQLKMKIIAVAGADMTLKRQKQEMHKLICKEFYKNLRKERKTKTQKTKLSTDIAKIIKKRSISDTLAIVGATKAAAAKVKKDADLKKAEKAIVVRERALVKAKKASLSPIKKAKEAADKVKKLEKEAEQAKKKAAASRKKSPAKASSKRSKTRGGRKVTFKTSTRQSARLKTKAADKTEKAQTARRTSARLKKSAKKATERVKEAKKAVETAKKVKKRVSKRKLPRL